MTAQQVERHMFDGGEVGGGMLGADPALVVSEDAVHQPVHAFDRPVMADDLGELVGAICRRGDVEAGFPFDLDVDLTPAFDHDHGLQSGPAVVFLEPADVMEDGRAAAHDAAMVALDTL